MNLKKPKFWDYKKPSVYSYFLLPFAYLIKIAKIFKKRRKYVNPDIKIICIGNIYVGGTGKTSLCIQINEIFKKQKIKSCFIKKYYPDQIDEQELLKNKGKLFLNSRRIDAINQAQSEGYEVAILDDGLQDTSINYDISFVCFNTLNWIGNGLTIPAGPLRESINNLVKYNHIFLNGNLENLDIIKKYLLKINSKIHIHVGKYEASNLEKFDSANKYLIFSGIGNHKTFVSMIKNCGLNIIKDIEFPDHYNYTDRDINQILKQANAMNAKIITTEKDYYRLKNKKIDNIKIIKSELKIIDEKKLTNIIMKKYETN